jgi:hypothetical protein
MNQTKAFSLALAVSCALAGVAHAGHEIVDSGKKQVIIEEPAALHGSVSAGYSTKYIFRGTNLMPSSDGMIYADAHVSYGGFTLGVWFGSQMGSAQVQNARAIGEGGGGGGGSFSATRTGTVGGDGRAPQDGGFLGVPAEVLFAFQDGTPFLSGDQGILGDSLVDSFIQTLPGVTKDGVLSFFQSQGINIPKYLTKFKTSSEVTQDRMNEIDLYLQYSFSLGPVDVTLGNIFFYIDRESTARVSFTEYFASEDSRELATFLTNTFFFNGSVAPDGRFNATSYGRGGDPESLLTNDGKRVSRVFRSVEDEQYDRVFVSLSTTKIPYISPRLTYYHTIYNEGTEAQKELRVLRNDEKGGYLEAKVNAEFPIIKDRVNFDPYALVSYSFGDRSDKDGAALYGWNHIQAGAELVVQVTDSFRLVPQINWMGRLADPTPGTNEDEWWGGAKAEVSF